MGSVPRKASKCIRRMGPALPYISPPVSKGGPCSCIWKVTCKQSSKEVREEAGHTPRGACSPPKGSGVRTLRREWERAGPRAEAAKTLERGEQARWLLRGQRAEAAGSRPTLAAVWLLPRQTEGRLVGPCWVRGCLWGSRCVQRGGTEAEVELPAGPAPWMGPDLRVALTSPRRAVTGGAPPREGSATLHEVPSEHPQDVTGERRRPAALPAARCEGLAGAPRRAHRCVSGRGQNLGFSSSEAGNPRRTRATPGEDHTGCRFEKRPRDRLAGRGSRPGKEAGRARRRDEPSRWREVVLYRCLWKPEPAELPARARSQR